MNVRALRVESITFTLPVDDTSVTLLFVVVSVMVDGVAVAAASAASAAAVAAAAVPPPTLSKALLPRRKKRGTDDERLNRRLPADTVNGPATILGFGLAWLDVADADEGDGGVGRCCCCCCCCCWRVSPVPFFKKFAARRMTSAGTGGRTTAALPALCGDS